jgi:hypothetical protein
VLGVKENRLTSLPAAAGPVESQFKVVDRGLGRLSLRSGDGRYVTVAADGTISLSSEQTGDAQTFQWVDIERGRIMLMSLVNHRYLIANPGSAAVANHPVPRPDRKDGSCFTLDIIR